MKRVIRFSKIRFLMFVFSLLLIAAGFIGLVLRNGFNLGVDFTGGINKQFQIAPAAFSIQFTGEGQAVTNLYGGKLEIEFSQKDASETLVFDFKDYPYIRDLVAALQNTSGVKVELLGYPQIATVYLISLNFPVDIAKERLVINMRLAPEAEIFAPIQSVREALAELGFFSIQVIGEPRSQEFVLKVPTPSDSEEDDKGFLQKIDSNIVELLGSKFGADSVLLKKTDFVGSVFSLDLVRGAIWSIIVALVLILVYITFRFKFIFAVAAILALIHDVSVMVGVIGTFQLEVTSATIAAVLTIIGYSLNDTIVVFDRIRENTALMPEENRADIIDISISQSLSRTTITSLTTLLAVIAIFIFGTGVIKVFALNLIVGVVVGTYSSIFIASPIVLGWQNVLERRKRAREARRTGGLVRPAKEGIAQKEREQVRAKNEEAVLAAKVEAQAEEIRVAAQSRPLAQRRKKKKKKRR
jgi:preprotein translocase subunit SecF